MKNRFSQLFLLASSCLLYNVIAFSQTLAPYTVSGRVRDELDRDLAGVRVCALVQKSRNANCGLSNAAGEFVIRLPEAGRYRILPEKSQDGYFPQYQPFFRHPSTPIIVVVLNDSTRSAAVTIMVGPKNGALRGKTLDAVTRRPIENVKFILCHAAKPGICWASSAKNIDGDYKIPVSHVPFTLKASADGYEDWLGLSGSDKDTAISVASGSAMELNLYLRRKSEAVGQALSEAEKQPYLDLPAPIQLSPLDRAEFNSYPRHTRLEWQPVEGAASYGVEVDYCDGRSKNQRECSNPQPHAMRQKTTGISANSFEFDFVGAQPGRWRVWAVDQNGREGFKSPWRIFFYLR